MIKPSLQTVETHGEKPEQDDPFDLSKLRLDQSFAETVGVKKLLRTVPVRKPNSQDFIRVHPDPNYRGNFSIVDLHDEREIYLVTPSMMPELMGECIGATLFTCINRQGVVRIWPVKQPSPDGKINEWHRSAAEAAELAMTSVDPGEGKHGPGRVRDVRRREHDPRTNVAGLTVSRTAPDRIQGPLYRQP